MVVGRVDSSRLCVCVGGVHDATGTTMQRQALYSGWPWTTDVFLDSVASQKRKNAIRLKASRDPYRIANMHR